MSVGAPTQPPSNPPLRITSRSQVGAPTQPLSKTLLYITVRLPLSFLSFSHYNLQSAHDFRNKHRFPSHHLIATPTRLANRPMGGQMKQKKSYIKAMVSANESIRVIHPLNIGIEQEDISTRKHQDSDQHATARPRCLVDRAHYRSSEPVAAAAIPPRTSSQSTP